MRITSNAVEDFEGRVAPSAETTTDALLVTVLLLSITSNAVEDLEERVACISSAVISVICFNAPLACFKISVSTRAFFWHSRDPLLALRVVFSSLRSSSGFRV